MHHSFAQYPPQSLCTLLYNCPTCPDPLLYTLPCCTVPCSTCVHKIVLHTCAQYHAPHMCLIPCSTLEPDTLLHTCGQYPTPHLCLIPCFALVINTNTLIHSFLSRGVLTIVRPHSHFITIFLFSFFFSACYVPCVQPSLFNCLFFISCLWNKKTCPYCGGNLSQQIEEWRQVLGCMKLFSSVSWELI